MDRRLIAWARAARARRRGRGDAWPPLWLFTDAERMPDPRPAVAHLPRRLCGVVFRHDGVPGRAALARDIARLCRARGNLLSVAGDARLAAALRAGVHLRGGAWPGGRRRWPRFATSSAHGPAELRRAARAGAALVFLSPVFPTASHPGARALGARRWTALARGVPIPVLALGGVTGATVRRLPRPACAGVAGIGGFGPRGAGCCDRVTVFRNCRAQGDLTVAAT